MIDQKVIEDILKDRARIAHDICFRRGFENRQLTDEERVLVDRGWNALQSLYERYPDVKYAGVAAILE